MSDPPPKKVGSLRDRIAAFENKGTSSPAAGPAPAPRPKPGNISWKPKQPSPPTSPKQGGSDLPVSPGVETSDGPKKTGGMSAADAKESIGMGGSLKERMAALQGKSAFGGAVSVPGPPKPAGEKPKWKPPPVVQVAQAIGDEDQDQSAAAAPPPAILVSPGQERTEDQALKAVFHPVEGGEHSSTEAPDATAEANDGETDPEEEERQRRAALAARMARLGGARFGMGAVPIPGKKPEIPKAEPSAPTPAAVPASEPKVDAPAQEPEVAKDTTTDAINEVEAQVTQPHESTFDTSAPQVKSEDTEDGPTRTDPSILPPALSRTTSNVLSTDDALSPPLSIKLPTSMPVSAAPRRAAPPRKKPSKSPIPSPTATPAPEPAELADVAKSVEPVGTLDSTPAKAPDADAEAEAEVAPAESITQKKEEEKEDTTSTAAPVHVDVDDATVEAAIIADRAEESKSDSQSQDKDFKSEEPSAPTASTGIVSAVTSSAPVSAISNAATGLVSAVAGVAAAVVEPITGPPKEEAQERQEKEVPATLSTTAENAATAVTATLAGAAEAVAESATVKPDHALEHDVAESEPKFTETLLAPENLPETRANPATDAKENEDKEDDAVRAGKEEKNEAENGNEKEKAETSDTVAESIPTQPAQVEAEEKEQPDVVSPPEAAPKPVRATSTSAESTSAELNAPIAPTVPLAPPHEEFASPSEHTATTGISHSDTYEHPSVLQPVEDNLARNSMSPPVSMPTSQIEEEPPVTQSNVSAPGTLTSPAPVPAHEPVASPDAGTNDEDEEDETARRARIAARLAKMGGVNPFAAPQPPSRKASVDPQAHSHPEPELEESTATTKPGAVPESTVGVVTETKVEEKEEDRVIPSPVQHAVLPPNYGRKIPAVPEDVNDDGDADDVDDDEWLEEEQVAASALGDVRDEEEEEAPPSLPPPRALPPPPRQVPAPPPLMMSSNANDNSPAIPLDGDDEDDEIQRQLRASTPQRQRQESEDGNEDENDEHMADATPEVPPPPPTRPSVMSSPPPPRQVPPPPAFEESDEELEEGMLNDEHAAEVAVAVPVSTVSEIHARELPHPPPSEPSAPAPPARPVGPPGTLEADLDDEPEDEELAAPPPPPRGPRPSPPAMVHYGEGDPEEEAEDEIEEDDGPPPLPAGRHSSIAAPTAPASTASGENISPAQVGNDEDDESPPSLPAGRHTQSPPQLALKQSLVLEHLLDREIFHDDEGDPIDPRFHSPRSTTASRFSQTISPVTHPAHAPKPVVPAPPAPTARPVVSPPVPQAIVSPNIATPSSAPVSVPAAAAGDADDDEDADAEKARRRTIAERMAKLGGVRFGGLPASPRPPVSRPQEEVRVPEAEKERANEGDEGPENEEDEQARRERIRAKLAGMGGMRFGMFPPGPAAASASAPTSAPAPPPARSPPQDEGFGASDEAAPPPPSRPQRAPPPPQPLELEEEEEGEDGDEEAEAPPPPPARRPSVPVSQPPSTFADDEEAPPPPPARRPVVPAPSAAHPNREEESLSRSVDVIKPEDYEDAQQYDEPPPPPPPRAAPVAPSFSRGDSQWELPDIPSSGAIDLQPETGHTSPSRWSEDSTAYPPAPPVKPTVSQAAPPPPSIADVQYDADELMIIWGRVGVHIVQAATELQEKSKKSIVGDGSYAGFLHAVIAEVPNALPPSGQPLSYGYIVYAQQGQTVQRRVADVMPGDVIALYDAKFKGHKGLQTYSQHIGMEEPCVGVVCEIEAKKFKVRALHANQHVSQQNVENVSYRLEDLKSGQVKIFRVLERMA